eukprot:GSChrysophyteH1.ASY1.ANO1.1528.1 assembled CDS
MPFPNVIVDSTEELLNLLKRSDDVSYREMEKALRSLRPAPSGGMDDYAVPLKLRLKEIISNNARGLSNEGRATASTTLLDFEKSYDKLRRINPAILNSVLTLLEPLSFPKPMNGYFKQTTSSTTGMEGGSSMPIPPVQGLFEHDRDESLLSERPSVPPAPAAARLTAVDVSTANSDAAVDTYAWCNQETENLLLRDLLFIFQNIQGKHVKYDPRSGLYGKGVIVQAFCFALQAELHDYYRLLSILENELNSKNFPMTLHNDGNTSGLTLLRLRAWMEEPLGRMLLLAKLVESAGPLRGGALASRLHSHKRHGDKAIKDMVNRIMKTVCAPIYSMLERWILHGELHDPYHEFFVGYRPGVSAANVWQDGYFLRMNMIPTNFPPSLARKVFLIGKTVNFMRLSQGYLAADVDILTTTSKAVMPSMTFGHEEDLAEAISRVSAITDARLLGLIEHGHHLHTHLYALKQFLLLGQGDFVVGLMDIVGPELRKRATQLYRHNLTGMLEGALRSSNAQFLPTNVLDRIGIKLLEASPGDTGWEYRTAFQLLWRLKRVEWTLSSGWKQQLLFRHSKGAMGGLPRLRSVMHRCSLNRARMLHVVATLNTYLMFEVLETEWQLLESRLLQCASLEEVIEAHDTYIGNLLQRSLLTASDDSLNLQLQQMLQSILRFCSLEDTLMADAMSALARKKAREEIAIKAGQWAPDAEDPKSYDGVPAYVVQRLDESVKDYSLQFDALMAMLHEEAEKHGDISRFLALRLDFNEYHAIEKKQGKSGVVTGTPPATAQQIDHTLSAMKVTSRLSFT